MTKATKATEATEAARGTEATVADPLQLVVPPEGVTLVGARPSKTGEGGQGLTPDTGWHHMSAMVTLGGSVTVLVFLCAVTLPAVPLAASPPCFTALYLRAR